MENFVLWIDNDACPRKIREVIFKAAARLNFHIRIVANSYMHPPMGVSAEVITVGSEFDAADNYIAENANEGDIVITADVPLAARVVERGATAISPRGQKFDSESISEKLAMRNLSQELRSAGDIQGGPPAFGPKDVNKFAGLFDRLITQTLKSKK